MVLTSKSARVKNGSENLITIYGDVFLFLGGGRSRSRDEVSKTWRVDWGGCWRKDQIDECDGRRWVVCEMRKFGGRGGILRTKERMKSVQRESRHDMGGCDVFCWRMPELQRIKCNMSGQVRG